MATGVAFRIRDFQNMYILELDRSGGGIRRLIRLYKGLATILCERHDGGYVPDTWYKIHIDTSHGRIRICIGEVVQKRMVNSLYQERKGARWRKYLTSKMRHLLALLLCLPYGLFVCHALDGGSYWSVCVRDRSGPSGLMGRD